MSLAKRIEDYENRATYKIIPRIPIAIVLTGRSFEKMTSSIEKPFSNAFSEGMVSTALKLAKESADSVVFVYTFSDQIVIISRQDKPDAVPWYDNDVQKMASVTSSIASVHLSNYCQENSVDLSGEPIFITKVFGLPDYSECVNLLIQKQYECVTQSVDRLFYHHVHSSMDKHSFYSLQEELSTEDKAEYLRERDIEFNDIPMHMRGGISIYRISKLVGESIRKKWEVNYNMQSFVQSHALLLNIIKDGYDVFR
jgi:tRNA(His) 5'-end guanylyltransferase